IMGLMMLSAGPGTTITVEASGREAAEVVAALAALVSGRFTEEE
ncbi:MAG TPA: HPr family phosphocarrier protein, partial [Xanthobacteraceae bacterium]|nr:HPr family phosphocarrier protein [Xanthobacteraceae bacterium]